MSLRSFLIRHQLLAISLWLVIGGCSHGEIPKWEGKLYAGDSQKGGISRAQDAEFISAKDAQFDEFIAMSYDDFKSFYSVYVLGCKEWRKSVSTMSMSQAYKKLLVLEQDLNMGRKSQ